MTRSRLMNPMFRNSFLINKDFSITIFERIVKQAIVKTGILF